MAELAHMGVLGPLGRREDYMACYPVLKGLRNNARPGHPFELTLAWYWFTGEGRGG